MPLLPADFIQPSLQINLRIILDGTSVLFSVTKNHRHAALHCVPVVTFILLFAEV